MRIVSSFRYVAFKSFINFHIKSFSITVKIDQQFYYYIFTAALGDMFRVAVYPRSPKRSVSDCTTDLYRKVQKHDFTIAPSSYKANSFSLEFLFFYRFYRHGLAIQINYIHTSFSLMCGNTYYILKVLADNVNLPYVTYAMYISEHYEKEKIWKNKFFSNLFRTLFHKL